ncbi:MAG: hypothetical protein JKX84_00125 [Flavobacteriales bacterium]|nr:hypothetical protein [Flavobacteriales bacterium]
MRHLRFLLFLLILQQTNVLFAQVSRAGLMVEPFTNRVFIEEKGQFADKVASKEMNVAEPILYALENAEFNAYFTSTGINFQFAERKIIPKGERVKIENEPEERGIETTWHFVKLNLQNANADVQVSANQKVHE